MVRPTAARRRSGRRRRRARRPTALSVGPARARFHDLAAAHAAALGPDGAWRWLAEHGLLAIARHPGLPPAAGERLADAARHNLAANLFRIDRFRAAATALAGLAVCPLKGIYLLDTVYRDDPQHRVLGDLDLLVRAAEVDAAVRCLVPLGLAETAASRGAGSGWHERVLAGDGFVVELHTRLAVKHAPRTTWDDLAPHPAAVHGRSVSILDDETTLVHLVTHWVKHVPFRELRWVEDVLRWLERGVDGEAAWRHARRLGAARSMVAGARALRALAGPELLPGVPQRLRGAAQAAIAANERWVWGGRLATPLTAPPAATAARRNLSALLLADTVADATSFLAAKARELTRRRSTQAGPRQSW
ncbi:MAG TPA: nucleotidyltransferase family protein [Thermoanaerobaculia bacterium]|nr:nucleotidyltransferase family protein [Thermoanaerobaculia bacterium]